MGLGTWFSNVQARDLMLEFRFADVLLWRRQVYCRDLFFKFFNIVGHSFPRFYPVFTSGRTVLYGFLLDIICFCYRANCPKQGSASLPCHPHMFVELHWGYSGIHGLVQWCTDSLRRLFCRLSPRFYRQ